MLKEELIYYKIARKIIVTNDNVKNILQKINRETIYFLYNLNKEYYELFKGYNFLEIDSFKKEILFQTIKPDILYIFKKDDKKVYRRTKLLDFLNKKGYNVISYEITEDVLKDEVMFDLYLESIHNNITKFDPMVIFSFLNGDTHLEYTLLNGNNTNKIIYDKFDETSNLFLGENDILLQDASNLIFVSSKNIQNNIRIKNKKVFYIPNGCTVKEYKPVDKYKTKTAVYCGYNINKIDFGLLNLLKALNEDWNIEVIGIPEDKLEQIKEENPDLIIKGWMNEEDLHKELSYCHLGLCLLEINDVTKGQLSDKFFNYINAHIPMLVNEELMENYKDYKDFVSPLDFDKLELDNYLKNIPDEKYNELLKECDWDNRFDQMMNIVKEQGLLSE